MAGVSRVCWPAQGGLSPGLEEFKPRGREQAWKAVTRPSHTPLCNALCKAARVFEHHHFKGLGFQKTPAGYDRLTQDLGTDLAGKGQSPTAGPFIRRPAPIPLLSAHTQGSSKFIKSSQDFLSHGLKRFSTKRLCTSIIQWSSLHSCAVVSSLMRVYCYFSY